MMSEQTPYEGLCRVLRAYIRKRTDAIALSFGTVPVEFDTKLLGYRYGEYKGIFYRSEGWSYDGAFGGRTLVFLTEQVGGLTESQLKALVEEITKGGIAEPPGCGKCTISITAPFVFVNFSFFEYD